MKIGKRRNKRENKGFSLTSTLQLLSIFALIDDNEENDDDDGDDDEEDLRRQSSQIDGEAFVATLSAEHTNFNTQAATLVKLRAYI